MRLPAAVLAALCAALPVAAAPQAELTEDVLARHRDNDRCRPLHETAPEIHVLPGDQRLFILPCSSGAYNLSSAFYLESFGEVSLLLFADYTEDLGWTGAGEVFLPDFDPETGVLTSFYNGRGLGDCGSAATWRWAGYAFALEEFRFKAECDGEAGDFPVIFTAP